MIVAVNQKILAIFLLHRARAGKQQHPSVSITS